MPPVVSADDSAPSGDPASPRARETL